MPAERQGRTQESKNGEEWREANATAAAGGWGAALTFPIGNVVPDSHLLHKLQEHPVLFWGPVTPPEVLIVGLKRLQALESSAMGLEGERKHKLLWDYWGRTGMKRLWLELFYMDLIWVDEG